MHVLVTGGTGFVGSHTVASLLDAGHSVRLLVRSPARIGPALMPHGFTPADVEHVTGDITDAPAVRRAVHGCDSVVHAASVFTFGAGLREARAMLRTNVLGTETVLGEAYAARLDPIVYVSSSFAIAQPGPTLLTEEAPVATPPEPYPRSKARAERVARGLQERGAPVVITYPGGVWGPHDPYMGETNAFILTALKGGLRFTVDGPVAFSDVREIARLHAAVMESGRGPRRYLVPSHSPHFADVIGLMAGMTGRALPVTVLPAAAALPPVRVLTWLRRIFGIPVPLIYEGPWMVSRRNAYGSSRAQAEFGIEPRPFEETVRDTLTWLAGSGRAAPELFGRLAPGGAGRPYSSAND